VQALHNAAQDGDTITLPAGIFTWRTRVTISKAITLQGAGVGSTIVRDAVQSGQLIHWSLVAGFTSRLTGMEFQDGGRIHEAFAPGGILHVDGSNTNDSKFRMDNCKWNNLNGAPVFDTVIGVVDHNQFVLGEFGTAIYIYGSYWDGKTFGDGSWSAPTDFGSSQFLFIEDNDIVNNRASSAAMTDAYAGARFVVRHNTIFNARVGNHGTESTGRARGGRAMEIYQNTFTGTNLNKFVGGARSGIVLLHDNRISGYENNPLFTLSSFRNFFSFSPWGGADGTNAWDVNKHRRFFRGTAAANSSGTTVTVSGANWTRNRWVGYTIRRTSNVCGSGSVTYGQITSNTANTITYTDNGGFPTPSLSFCKGDALEIRKVDHALDQPGRARGSLITGDPPIRPRNWNNQVTEPCYSWNNFSGATHVNFSPQQENIRNGEHFFNNTPMPGYTPYIYPHPLIARAMVSDFNGDGSPDFVLQNASTGQTAVWYMDNNTRINSAFGPTGGWPVAGVADFNLDGDPDYLLFNPSTGQTAIWYLNNNVHVSSAFGPTIWAGWDVAAVADFNEDGHPDYLLFRPSTGQTAIWYLDNNVRVSSALGPTTWAGWNVAGVADFNNDGHPDYLLFRPSTGQTAIWYLNDYVPVFSAFGPTTWAGWSLVAP
jgi:FG-GAP-like repeat